MLSRLNRLAKTGLLIAALVAAVLIIAVTVSTVIHSRDGERQSSQVTYSVTLDQWKAYTQGVSPDTPVLAIGFYVSAVDPRAYNVKVSVSSIFATVGAVEKTITGQGLNFEEEVAIRTPIGFNLTLGDKETPFRANNIIPRQEITLPITEGMPTNYPMDKYKAELFIEANTLINGTEVGIPTLAFTYSALQLFNIDTNFTYISQTDTYSMVASIDIKRSRMVVGYSIFVIIIMWVLSLSLFTMSVGIWVRKRKVEPPTIGVATAMLFALPNVRNAQPGIGDIGSLGDVAGYFWNMVLIVASVLLLLWNYIILYRADNSVLTQLEKKKKTDAPQTPVAVPSPQASSTTVAGGDIEVAPAKPAAV
ncbi:hypothetical protein HK102_003697 [Quaeritorhiza haematococci]|nr:hypothetical protein HK102_003697 [Quaeritorhiza haematococci]